MSNGADPDHVPPATLSDIHGVLEQILDAIEELSMVQSLLFKHLSGESVDDVIEEGLRLRREESEE